MITISNFQYPADYDKIMQMWKDAGEGLGINYSDEPEEIEKKLIHDPNLFLIAKDDQKIVGSVIGGFDGRRGMIYHLAVSYDYRRNGLATELMNEIENRLRNQGCRKVYLLLKKGNINAKLFYEKFGWELMDHVNIYGKKL